MPGEVLAALDHFGLSSICNVLTAIKLAKRIGAGASDALLTVATDGAALYPSELERIRARDFGEGFGREQAARVYDEHVSGADDDHLRELDERERDRIFNLGYFTWVEQQGVSLEDFERRRSQAYWQ